MSHVWKFPLVPSDLPPQEVLMPAGARLLDVQMQQGQIVLWALVNEPKAEEVRRFRAVGTNHWIEDEDIVAYVGTVQQGSNGVPVWHVFEVR